MIIRALGVALLPLLRSPPCAFTSQSVAHKTSTEANRNDIAQPDSCSHRQRDRRESRVVVNKSAVDIAFVRAKHAGHCAAENDGVRKQSISGLGSWEVIEKNWLPVRNWTCTSYKE